jgi:hypothetical protein
MLAGVLVPSRAGPLHPHFDEALSGRLDVATSDGQPRAAVLRVVHPGGVMSQLGPCFVLRGQDVSSGSRGTPHDAISDAIRSAA